MKHFWIVIMEIIIIGAAATLIINYFSSDKKED
jgi:hypothetical protein